MKNLLNMAFMLCLCLLPSSHIWASGSTTVYLQFGPEDITLEKSQDFTLESAERTVLIATIDRSYYQYVDDKLLNRFKVYIQFEKLGFVRMYYNPELDLILGSTRDNSIIILWPRD